MIIYTIFGVITCLIYSIVVFEDSHTNLFKIIISFGFIFITWPIWLLSYFITVLIYSMSNFKD